MKIVLFLSKTFSLLSASEEEEKTIKTVFSLLNLFSNKNGSSHVCNGRI